ncbi:MAG TPA: hypothetical protein VN708_19590 [Terriglobales bacterium]|jgi:hypothetical protein|nr:hypothetical protein [Terriglobales bacterium]
MAEPLSALPKARSSNTAVKAEPVPWPKIQEPHPELPEFASADRSTEKRVQHLRSGFERSYREVSRAILDTWNRSRRKFHHISQEHPLRLVIGVAVAAFMTGAAVRIWRSNHD